ncbi:unnamed protein product [Dracunculus medinensis]|uniref:Transthyretin-like family protein n=1 Tax=Dracunculus medinensis TaxID=318479 RepID=A0A158Q4Y1_DRAME|nr:unnamed protein product [Dracunculus medinensis]
MRFILALLALICFANCADVALRSVSVKGTLLCGKEPYGNAHVRLYRVSSKDDHEILEQKQTLSNGEFRLEGSTQGRPANETTMTPVVRIYHKCDEEPDKDTYRRFQLQIPSIYVTRSRVSRNEYDIGKINLQLIYPREESGIRLGS